MMNNEDKKVLAREIELFIDHLRLDYQLKTYFVTREYLNEVKVNEQRNLYCIYFNMWFIEPLPLKFAMLVVFHEIFHFAKQGLQDYTHILEMKYGHLWAFMQLYDIEADLHVADYMLKYKIIQDFAGYTEILHSGASVFKNPTIRLVKLERFIGSLVSIKQLIRTGKLKVFLPKLSLNTVIMVCIDYEAKQLRHSFYDIQTAELERWKVAFQQAEHMAWTDFITLVDSLTNDFY